MKAANNFVQIDLSAAQPRLINFFFVTFEGRMMQ